MRRAGRKGSLGTALPVRKGSLPAAAAPSKLTPLRRAALLSPNGSPGGWGAVPGGWGAVPGGWGAVPGGWGAVPGGWGAGCMRSRTIRTLPSARRSDTNEVGALSIESSSHLMGEAT